MGAISNQCARKVPDYLSISYRIDMVDSPGDLPNSVLSYLSKGIRCGRSGVQVLVMAPSAVHELLVRLASNLQGVIWSGSSAASMPGPLSSSMPLVINTALLHERLLPLGVESLLARMDVYDRQLVQALAVMMEHLIHAPAVTRYQAAASSSFNAGAEEEKAGLLMAGNHKRTRWLEHGGAARPLQDGIDPYTGGEFIGLMAPMAVMMTPPPPVPLPVLPPPLTPVFSDVGMVAAPAPMCVDTEVSGCPSSAPAMIDQDLRSAVLSSDDLLDRILEWLDAKSLVVAMQVHGQWNRSGRRDQLWRGLVERDYPNTRILLKDANLDGHFRQFYRKLDRSMELYADRNHNLDLREVFVWLDVGYCLEEQFVPLGRKSVAFGHGEAFLGRPQHLVGPEASIFRCTGPTPLQALSSFFTQWSMSTDVSLYDRTRRRHAVVALDVGHPTVVALSDQEFEVHNDEQDDYSSGELCVNLFATLTATRVPEMDRHWPPDGGATSWAFILTKIALEPCFSFGKGENSRELAIEPANSHDLVSSILLMAKWV